MDKPKILVVEDEIVIARDIKRILEKSGYEVPATSSTGEEAINKADQLKPDLVIMDIILKGKMDGIETAHKIYQEYDIPVVFLTSYDDKDILNRAKETDPFGYLLKPFNNRELYVTIEIALHKHKTEKRLRVERDKGDGLVRKLEDTLNKIKLMQSRTEDQLKSSIMEKEMLIREIQHRVNNNLQIIISLLRLQYKDLKDNGYMGAFKSIQNRIRTIATAYEKLYRSEKPGVIEFLDYMRSITSGLFRFYEIDNNRISFEIEGEELFFGIDTVIPCGLIINEIITNSLSYAFPDNQKGKVRLSINSPAEDTYEIVVSDNGIGMPKEIDINRSESLGLQLITGFVEEQLQGHIRLDRTGGTTFYLKFKD